PGQALAVEIDAAEAAELLLSIATLLAEDDRDTYELEAARIDEARAAVPPELLDAAAELFAETSASQLLGLVYTTPKPRTASALLDHLAATDPVEIRLHLLGYYGGHHVTEAATGRRAAEGDAGAIAEVLEAYSEYVDAEKCAKAGRLLDTDPGEGRAALLGILTGWYEQIFPLIAPEDSTLAERDAEAKRELVKAVPPEQVVERLVPGVPWAPGPPVHPVVL